MLEKFLSRVRAKVANKLISIQHRKGRILDIGCGEYPHFLINIEFNEKYGIDRLVEEGVFNNKGREGIILKKCDIQRDALRSFEEGSFDVVTMLAVFEHLEPQILAGLVEEIRRILKVNGIFILTTPTPWSDIILQVLSKLKLVNSVLFEEHKGVYDAKRISLIIIKGGFLKEDIKFGYFELFMNSWLSVIKK